MELVDLTSSSCSTLLQNQSSRLLKRNWSPLSSSSSSELETSSKITMMDSSMRSSCSSSTGGNSRFMNIMQAMNVDVANRLMEEKTSHYRLLKQMPKGLYRFWLQMVTDKFIMVPTSPMFFVEPSVGLMDYFKCVEIARGEATVLTSCAADSVWMAWLAYDDQHPTTVLHSKSRLRNFTRRNFGNEITHPSPVSAMEFEDALSRTYVLNCIINGLDFAEGLIPSLFRLDGVVRMPNGSRYTRISSVDGIGHRILDIHGRASGNVILHPGISLQTFQKLGYMRSFRDEKLDGLRMLLNEPKFGRQTRHVKQQIETDFADAELFMNSWNVAPCEYDPYLQYVSRC